MEIKDWLDVIADILQVASFSFVLIEFLKNRK